MAQSTASGKRSDADRTGAEANAEAASARTFGQLLRLWREAQGATARASVELAISRLKAVETCAAGEEMHAWMAAHPNDSLPRQFTDALLQRWLTLEPLAALKTMAAFPGLIPAGSTRSFRTPSEPTPFHWPALAREAVEHFEEVAPLMEKLGVPDEDLTEALEDLPPQEALPKLVAITAAGTRAMGGAATNAGDLPARWIASDARGAMQWALSLPANSTRRSLLRTMAGAWGGRDAAEASRFIRETPLSTLPAGPLRDTLIQDISFAAFAAEAAIPPPAADTPSPGQ
jgi:hypothetical protein